MRKGVSFLRFPAKYTSANIRRSWILSYVIILLLPLVINSFVYLNAYDTIKLQAQEAQKSALERFRLKMDNEFSRMEEAVSVISYDVNMNYFLDATGMESFEQNYTTASRVYHLSESLRLSLPGDGLISDTYVFSTGNSLVLHNSGVNDIAQYGSLPNNYTESLYAKCQTLDPQATNLFVFTPDTDTSFLALMYPLPYSWLPKGYIVLLLEHSVLSAAMESLYSEPDSRIYLTDASFSSLNSSAALPDPEVFADCDFSQSSVLGKLPGETGDFLMYSVPSQVLPLHYICTLPESVATADLIYMRQSLLISLLFCLAGGVLLIALLTRYNYGPWQNLLNTVRKFSTSSAQSGTNEYQIILNALVNSYQEKATIEEVFHNQNHILYSYYLSRMLTGHMGIENMEESILSDMETRFGLSRFVVLASLSDVRESWPADHAELIQDAYLSFFDTHIAQRLQNLLGQSFSITFTEVYDYTACVIGVEAQETDTWQDRLASALESIAQDLYKELNIQYYFSFSNLHQNISELSLAWDEASSAISLCVMNREKSPVFYKDMEFTDAVGYTYSAKSEQTLINLIQIGQTENVTGQIHVLLEENARHFPVFEAAKCNAADIMCSITKAFSHLPDSSQQRLQNQYYSILGNFMQAASYKALQQRILEASALITGEYKQIKEKPTPQSIWLPKIEEQINTWLYDENLNVMFLSHKLGLSSKYLSSIYFEANGVSIMDTIHKRRIEKFKELICESNMTIQDAAAAVGYSSIATLNRWVRKYEGVTPGQLKMSGSH